MSSVLTRPQEQQALLGVALKEKPPRLQQLENTAQ